MGPPTAVSSTAAPTIPLQTLPGRWSFDSSIRTISNLIVDQTLANPAALQKARKFAGIEGTARTTAEADISAAFEVYKASLRSLPISRPRN